MFCNTAALKYMIFNTTLYMKISHKIYFILQGYKNTKDGNQIYKEWA